MPESRDDRRKIKSATLLLVEDEVLIAMAEARMLERHGFIIHIAYSPDEALRLGTQDDIQLILMDIDLGKNVMNGIEAAKQILSERSVPVIFLTSHSEREYIEQIRTVGQHEYVLKSWGEKKLVESIHSLFNSI